LIRSQSAFHRALIAFALHLLAFFYEFTVSLPGAFIGLADQLLSRLCRILSGLCGFAGGLINTALRLIQLVESRETARFYTARICGSSGYLGLRTANVVVRAVAFRGAVDMLVGAFATWGTIDRRLIRKINHLVELRIWQARVR